MLLLARVNSDSGIYRAVLVLHILAVVVAFAPAIVHPMVAARLKKSDPTASRAFSGVAAANGRSVHSPALLLVGLLGYGLVAMSDKEWRSQDPWVEISIVLWLVIAALHSAVIMPSERKLAAGDDSVEGRLKAAGGAVVVLLAAVVYLMVVKPGHR